MEKDIALIQQHAKELEKLENNEQYLFEKLNSLEKSQLATLKEFYSTSIGPVNILRLVIIKYLEMGELVTPVAIESTKNKIIRKDIDFFSEYDQSIKDYIQNYPTQLKKSPFHSWKNFSILFPFFYSNELKDLTGKALPSISNELINKLKLKKYKFHNVSFPGPQQWGSSSCWIALFPEQKISHQNAYQLFLRIYAERFEAGIIAGGRIGDKKSNNLEELNSIEEVIEKLELSKPIVKEKNDALINYWKIAPGQNAVRWEEFFKDGIMAIGWDLLDNLNNYDNDSLVEALDVPNPETSNNIGSILGFRDASIGDVVIANKGKSKAVGIGIITGEYIYDESRPEYKHTRQVNWLINHQVDFGKTIFRPDTFSVTLKWQLIKEKFILENPEFEKTFNDLEQGKEIQTPPKVIASESEDQNYWWLNANPKIWSIGSFEIGDIQTYTSHNERGNKRQIYKNFEQVKPGDLVLGYETTPLRQIKAIFEITEGLHEDDNEGEIISFEIKEFVDNPISRDFLKEVEGLENIPALRNSQGSLYEISLDEFNIIRDLIDETNIISEKEQTEIKIAEYSFQDDPEKPFISQTELEEIIHSLESKKNIVLQGPPGVGKTFIAKKIAYEMMGKTDDTKIDMVQFHQSYAYEDFIQGIRPTEKSFKVKNGIFYDFCKKAGNDPDNKYFFIIDEINRGNLSKIFGELMMLIETDKRDKHEIRLTYSEKDDAKFTVPANLYLIGTMNTADRSLAIVDYALRRRFRFIALSPNFNDQFTSFMVSNGFTQNFISKMVRKINDLNRSIKDDKNLGDGFQIGHSFFCSSLNSKTEEEWFRDIIKFEIKPLLEEYWFDDLDKVDKEINYLFEL